MRACMFVRVHACVYMCSNFMNGRMVFFLEKKEHIREYPRMNILCVVFCV